MPGETNSDGNLCCLGIGTDDVTMLRLGAWESCYKCSSEQCFSYYGYITNYPQNVSGINQTFIMLIDCVCVLWGGEVDLAQQEWLMSAPQYLAPQLKDSQARGWAHLRVSSFR